MVTLLEVLENGGYDIKNNYDDALWLLATQDEYEELIEECQEMVEKEGGYEN